MAAGFDPAGFWSLTPKLYLIHMRGARARIEMQAMADRSLAYNTAALSRARKLPPWREFIGGERKKARGLSALAMLRAHAARLPKRSWKEWQRHSSGR